MNIKFIINFSEVYNWLSRENFACNVDIKTLQLRWLRNQVGLVNQELVLFATTILESILYRKPDTIMAEVEAAASAANAYSFITFLLNRYNTQVGDLKFFRFTNFLLSVNMC